jgi:hypothetical protein
MRTRAEDLAQSIWAELYRSAVSKDGKPASKLAYYRDVVH